jgi:small subunit ribosomal protein S21
VRIFINGPRPDHVSFGESAAPWGTPASSCMTESGVTLKHDMSEVIIGEGESFEAALRRFNKKIQQAGILAEARRREYYERPAARRKRKEAKRRKR